jgi:hypothetical protein
MVYLKIKIFIFEIFFQKLIFLYKEQTAHFKQKVELYKQSFGQKQNFKRKKLNVEEFKPQVSQN